jgi:hypothetical protein
MENSFHSRGSKNFVLKSDYLSNTNSKRNSKKNLSFYDPNQNQNPNQKSLFRNSVSFADQEEDDNKKEKIIIQNSEKDLDTNLFNKAIFNDINENNNNWNKNKNNHSNIIQDYYNLENNIN